MKYFLVLSVDQITEVKKQNLEVEILNEDITPSGGISIQITIKDGTDLLSLFYAGVYYALDKKIND
jgi:hypothetical protein